VQACHLLIVDLHLASRVSDYDVLSVFLAAIIHNYRHPGLTNQYLMASQDSLSLLYNDVKQVENFACASAFRLLAEPANDFFSAFDPVLRQKVRQQTVALVFATNLADHAYFLGALMGTQNLCAPIASHRIDLSSCILLIDRFLPCVDARPDAVNSMLVEPATRPAQDASPCACSADALARASLMATPNPLAFITCIDFASKADPRADLVLKLLVKSASVSPSARGWPIYSRWSRLMMEEFYSQGDLERAEGMSLSQFMDREIPQEARCHHSFLLSVVQPLFAALSKLAPSNEKESPIAACLGAIESALEHWAELEELEGK
jgi:cAMP-specific phosphodiesterase 4